MLRSIKTSPNIEKKVKNDYKFGTFSILTTQRKIHCEEFLHENNHLYIIYITTWLWIDRIMF